MGILLDVEAKNWVMFIVIASSDWVTLIVVYVSVSVTFRLVLSCCAPTSALSSDPY
jgi:hypothetical protein